MVKAVVGANWGDEGKGKITDMLAKDAEQTQVIQSKIIMASLHYIHCPAVCSMTIRRALSVMVWLWM